MLLLALVNWGAFAQHDHAKHDEKKMDANVAMFKDAKLGAAYEHYIHLKDALVTSKSDEAKNAAKELQMSLAAVGDGKKASDEAANVIKGSTLAEQRKAFLELSNEMILLVQGGKLSMGAIYKEYCPMYGSSGGYWLSNEKQIKNPYFGDAMLNCGSVKETIQ